MNVVQAWYDYKYLGKGTIVIIVDDGLETTHLDLKDNYVSFRRASIAAVIRKIETQAA